MTWTNKFQQKKIYDFSNEVLEEILDKIFKANIEEFDKEGLNKFELKLLLRWNVYLSINTFTDRFLRAITNKNRVTKKQINFKNLFDHHYTNLIEVTLDYYNNNKLNNNLLNNIIFILNNSNQKKVQIKDTNRKKYYRKNLHFFKLKTLIKLIIFKYIYKIKEMHEGTEKLNLIFSENRSFINYPFIKENKICYKSRSIIRNIAQKIFIKRYSKFLTRDQNKINMISSVFANWIDHSIPLSILENLNERFLFYYKLLNYLKINTFHASTGFFTNENIKIFSILLKRKKIRIIGHEHGVTNFIIPGKTNFMSHYKTLDHFLYPNVFLSWGCEKKGADKWKNIRNFNLKILDAGSVYLNHINKLHDSNYTQKLRSNNKSAYLIFYCASQFRQFMTNLEEMTPEDNLQHKTKVCKFLKKVIMKKNIKLIYKQFPENINRKNDPFFAIFKNEIIKKKVIVSQENSVKIMHSVDLVVFDLISTGFGEAISINKPSIVYTNKFEYNRASPDGKKINDLFYKHGIFFNKDSSGIKSINAIMKDTNLFQENAKNLTNTFKQKISYPISKSIFLKKINNLI
ncbi:MAG: hypothetical protein CFH16_01285 [Alphaproteobacteria bacterium MarineAlpha5_Bin6]|nr:MAG: hypothetical protein CFH16_01285 [Alphaproteobacteria bacterium MarineAlpha5_Bin6]|tara:strand:+ start:1976 stop:3691 length:1716 start_codon:yes stop_codon:yes gene_type:complete